MNTDKLTKQTIAVNLLGTMGSACLLYGVITILIWLIDDPYYAKYMIGWALICFTCALVLFFVITVIRNVTIRKRIKNLERAAGVSFDESPFRALSVNVDVSDNWIVIGQDAGRVILPKNTIENMETTDPEGQRRKSIIRIYTTLRNIPVSLIADRNLDPDVFAKMKEWVGISDEPVERVCSFCGTVQEADARFCMECGRELADDVSQPTENKLDSSERFVAEKEGTKKSGIKAQYVIATVVILVLLFLFLFWILDRPESNLHTGKMVSVPVTEVV